MQKLWGSLLVKSWDVNQTVPLVSEWRNLVMSILGSFKIISRWLWHIRETFPAKFCTVASSIVCQSGARLPVLVANTGIIGKVGLSRRLWFLSLIKGDGISYSLLCQLHEVDRQQGLRILKKIIDRGRYLRHRTVKFNCNGRENPRNRLKNRHGPQEPEGSLTLRFLLLGGCLLEHF